MPQPPNSPASPIKTPPGSSSHRRSPRKLSAGLSPIEGFAPAPAEPTRPAEAMKPHAEMWSHVFLPAVTWLYGWVEWQMGSVHVPSIVEREHRAAFTFKEMGAALASATNALMAVSAFAKKLPMLGKGKSTPPASPKTEAAPTLDALLD